MHEGLQHFRIIQNPGQYVLIHMPQGQDDIRIAKLPIDTVLRPSNFEGRNNRGS